MNLCDRKTMELNGVANIRAILQVRVLNGGPVSSEEEVLMRKILAEVDTLERYMIACNRANKSGEDYPFWHEVRENKDKYLTIREELCAKHTKS